MMCCDVMIFVTICCPMSSCSSVASACGASQCGTLLDVAVGVAIVVVDDAVGVDVVCVSCCGCCPMASAAAFASCIIHKKGTISS